MRELELAAFVQRAAADRDSGHEHRPEQAAEQAEQRDQARPDEDDEQQQRDADPHCRLALEQIPAIRDPAPAVPGGARLAARHEVGAQHHGFVGERGLRRCVRIRRAHWPPFSLRRTLTVAMALATSEPSSFFASASTKLMLRPSFSTRASANRRAPLAPPMNEVLRSMVITPIESGCRVRAAVHSATSSSDTMTPPCAVPRLLVRWGSIGIDSRAVPAPSSSVWILRCWRYGIFFWYSRANSTFIRWSRPRRPRSPGR